MMRRRRAYYSRRPTLAELYDELPSLFNGLTLPEGLELSTLRSILLAQYGELDTICNNATDLAAYLAIWSAQNEEAWTRILEALTDEYNPLHNYDRTEHETEQASSGGSSSFTGRTDQSGTETATESVQGVNSTTYVPSSQTEREPDLHNQSVSSTQSVGSEQRGRDLHVSGNIGVMTSQDMLIEEVQLRSKYTAYGTIAEAFRRDICVGVW